MEVMNQAANWAIDQQATTINRRNAIMLANGAGEEFVIGFKNYEACRVIIPSFYAENRMFLKKKNYNLGQV
jgi:hypothetical protein